MILLAGIPTEPPVYLAIEAAQECGIPYVVFNQRQAHLYQLSLKIRDNVFKARLNIDGTDHELEQMQGAYVRLMDQHALPELNSKTFERISDSGAYKLNLVHRQFSQWMNITGIRILNPPGAMLSNMSKPYQAQMITPCGFYTPATCITNSAEAVLKFKKEKQNIIYKSTSAARSIVKELEGTAMGDLQKIRYLPTQFQEKLQGENIRVHVVGDVLFATAIHSNIVDYRYAEQEDGVTELSPTVLPVAVEKKCFNLAKQLQLPFCGIDLFRTNKGEYYCFEVNPSPGYSYYEKSTGQKISHAIVNYLAWGTAKKI